MPRVPAPRLWKDKYFVTEAGGRGIKILARKDEGIAKAKSVLAAYLKELEQEKKLREEGGLIQTDSPFTVAEIAAEFVAHKKAIKSESTAKFHQKNLYRWVEWYGHLPATKITLTHGDQYLAQLKKLYPPLSAVTINHHISSARSALRFAAKRGRIAKNPWPTEDLPKLAERRRERTMTDDEFTKLIAACDKCIAYRGLVSREENAQSRKDVLYILRFTAMRPGELRKLRWDHLSPTADLIRIPAREQKTGTTAKIPEDRLIPVMEEGQAIFLSRKKQYGHQPLVFPNLLGLKCSDSQFSRYFSQLRDRAGLGAPDQNNEKLVAYSLRHTRLSEAALREKWAYPLLQRMAGHARGSRITSRYIHADVEDLKRAAEEGQKNRQALAESQASKPREE